MEISKIGEFGLIELIKNTIGNHPDLQLGIGDDACAWNTRTGIQLATTDSLIENVHFEPKLTSWRDLGYKALAVNLSDIAAMAGIGSVALVSLALPGNIQSEDIISFYQGMLELAQETGIAIAGGNVSRSPIINITVTVIGTAGLSGKILRRSDARERDLIAITGYPGCAAAGRMVLSGQLKVSKEQADQLLSCFLRPHPRLEQGNILACEGASAAIDISDGLLSDLQHILSSSNVSAIIDVGKLPLKPLLKAGLSHHQAVELALGGGEDYELLFTASESVMEKIAATIGKGLSIIGTITSARSGCIKLAGNFTSFDNLKRAGWNHFG
ncbi:MAG: thiamine-phosphate kinase [Dehalococcoidales bacterium]